MRLLPGPVHCFRCLSPQPSFSWTTPQPSCRCLLQLPLPLALLGFNFAQLLFLPGWLLGGAVGSGGSRCEAGGGERHRLRAGGGERHSLLWVLSVGGQVSLSTRRRPRLRRPGRGDDGVKCGRAAPRGAAWKESALTSWQRVLRSRRSAPRPGASASPSIVNRSLIKKHSHYGKPPPRFLVPVLFFISPRLLSSPGVAEFNPFSAPFSFSW